MAIIGVMLDVHDLASMEDLRRSLRIDPHHLKRLRVAFYKNLAGPDRALAELPEGSRSRARATISFHHLEQLPHICTFALV